MRESEREGEREMEGRGGEMTLLTLTVVSSSQTVVRAGQACTHTYTCTATSETTQI